MLLILFKLKCIFLSLQPEIEEWSSWDEDAPTSIKIEGGNGSVPPSPSEENDEPDYFKDMAPTIRKTQKVSLSLYYKKKKCLKLIKFKILYCINIEQSSTRFLCENSTATRASYPETHVQMSTTY